MPLFMRIEDYRGIRDIPMNVTYDNLADLKHSGDFPERIFEMWAEKGKLIIQHKSANEQRKHMKNPNNGQFY